MPESIHYNPRDTEAAKRVIIELGQVLASHRHRFVVIGGSVPALVFPNGEPEHLGTLDVDLALDAAALADDNAYADLIGLMETAGYVRGEQHGLKPFQLRRTVDLGDGGESVPITVDLLKPPGRFPSQTPPLLENFRPVDAKGAAVALTHYELRHLTGRMPDGSENEVDLRVATIPAFLVMKGYALVGRKNDKDAYDIWYCLCREEPDRLAEACRPLLATPEAREGLTHLVSKFKTREFMGPVAVARFLADEFALGDLDPDQVQTDAFQRVKAFASALALTC